MPKFLPLLLLLFFATVGLNAQVTTASINGSVTDASGEALIGATVQATHTPTGTLYGVTTRADGGYDLPNLRIGGPYLIEVSYVGYESYREENLFLKLGQKLPLHIKLSDGAVDLEQVVVTALTESVIGSDRTGAETNLSTEDLEKLPTISRSASDYYRLTPTADGNSFGGRNDQFNNFSLDGSIFNNPFGLDAATPGGQTDAQPISLDAIEQINVSLAPYDVTLAGFTGASINAVTKSGTNEFKGTVFGFFRNQDMTGNKVGDQEIIVPDLEQFQAGFSLGGPIVKNKVFFFANFEIDNREDLGTSFIANRPGLTGENVSRVEAADLDAVSQALFNRYGYETGDYENYIHQTNNYKGLIKLDFNLNKNNTLTATYNFLDAFKDKPAHPNALGRRGPDLVTLQFANSGYRINNIIHSGIVELRSLISNNISNKLQVGYSAYRDSRNPFSTPAPVININRDGIRYIVAGHEPFSINNVLNQDVFQFTNNLNIYAGKHTITAGVSLERFDFDNSFNLNAYGGTFDGGFASVGAFLDSLDTGVYDALYNGAQATFDANGGDEGVEGEGWALAETNVGQAAIYVQDEFKLSDRFTLTGGIRLDMPLYFDTKTKIEENLARNGDYAPEIVWQDEDGNEIQYVHTDLPKQTPLVSPRLGFNYDIKGNQSAQLRGGTGLFSGRLPFVWVGNQVANPNWFFYNVTDRDFKFPQVWRSNLGYDHKFGNGWIGTVDLIHSKDLNAAMVRKYSFGPPSGTLGGGVDGRQVYLDSDYSVYNAIFEGFTLSPSNFVGTGYVFGNTNVGYTLNATVQVQKTFKNGLYVMLGYNFLDAKDATSIEAEISSDAFDRNPAIGNVNVPVAAPSLYGNRHRILGAAYKTFKYGNWGTTVSTFFQFAQGGTTQSDFTADYRFSYTYSGDINNDGSPLNDLIFIPTDEQLDRMAFTSDPEREAFRDYIEQDEYLSSNRGEYAEKYAILAPWNSQWDFRILQDFYFQAGKRTNTIQLSIDFLNLGNLISSSWNVKQLPINTQPVGVSVGSDGVPVYSFDTTLQNTFANDFSLASRWQMRLGLRYIF